MNSTFSPWLFYTNRFLCVQKEDTEMKIELTKEAVEKAKIIPRTPNPYRADSAYALVWNCLYQTRKKVPKSIGSIGVRSIGSIGGA